MYEVRNEGKKVPVKVNSNLGLREACLKIVDVPGGVVLLHGKLVAFWCNYHNMVKVGYQANEFEREKIRDWNLISGVKV